MDDEYACAVCYEVLELDKSEQGGVNEPCPRCGALNYIDWCPTDGPYVSGIIVCPVCNGSIQDETDEGAPICACGWEGQAP